MMVAQCLIAVWGYYAIRSFERWTVPVTALIMAVMSVLAVSAGRRLLRRRDRDRAPRSSPRSRS